MLDLSLWVGMNSEQGKLGQKVTWHTAAGAE